MSNWNNWNGPYRNEMIPNWMVNPTQTNAPYTPTWTGTSTSTAMLAQNLSSIIWVQGEAGAKAYPVQAGMTVLLMDSETPRFYIKSTSQNGIPMKLRVFDYSEILEGSSGSSPSIPEVRVAEQPYATKDDLNELKKLIEERIPDRRQKDNQHGKPSV